MERYKGRLIDPQVYRKQDGSGWIAEVYVSRAVDSNIADRLYVIKKTSATEEEAMAAALEEGRRVVDGGA